MDVGTVLSVAQTLFAALQCSQLKEMCSVLGYQSELENLTATVSTVKAVLKDAEAKQELSNEAQCYIENLKDAVYDADDLIDEFVTRAERKQNQLAEGRKISEKVRLFFSRFKDLGVARNLSRGVKEVRKRLDAIASNHNQFGFKLDSQPIQKRREETCSYVYAQDIIGREDDRKKVVGMVLDSDVQQNVSFLTIVGIGGLGKTTLAQLVYNDERVTNHFDLRLWACVSDEDPKHLDVKAILGKILGSDTGHKNDGSTMEWLQRRLQQLLAGKKYLLVLDDVWNENREEWLKLEKFLRGGLVGSWVVVTTRSKDTASVVEGGHMFELRGLSKEDSWCLFESVAFGQGKGRTNPPDLVEVGQKIVKKCANVPLAIRVAGSLLYGQGKDNWLSFQERGLANIRQDKSGILPILKLSYHNLESPLKSCFSYCAIFPKDSIITRENLISLWMAQGYIVPVDGQTIEEAAEEYFSILLRRCFFQDVTRNKSGEIFACKMHDLIHDVAQEVAGKEVCVVNSISSKVDRKTRHISFFGNGKDIKVEESFTKTGIRTCLRLSADEFSEDWICLRALDLTSSKIKSLPDIVGKMLHLRYLDLSYNHSVEALPKSITKLHNLQILTLRDCDKLKELPYDLSKLVKLRLLDIDGCSSLSHMPSGMGKLSCLQRLTMFVVGEANSSSKQDVVDMLKDLKALTNLRGHLRIKIKIPENTAAYVIKNSSIGGYLRSKQHVNSIDFEWAYRESGQRGDHHQKLFEDFESHHLEPHHSLRNLGLKGYPGMRLPSWIEGGDSGTFFPNLVEIRLIECHGLKYLSPSLGKLSHLRVLEVENMSDLEYVENRSRSNSVLGPSSFFPSLEVLMFQYLPKLKGWWIDDDSTSSSNSRQREPPLVPVPSFPRLSFLVIRFCPDLTFIPLCPSMVVLILRRFNERLQLIGKTTGTGTGTGSDQKTEPTCSSNSGKAKLKKVRHIDNIRALKSMLPMEALQCLTEMTINYDHEVESLEDALEAFHACSSSLQSLKIDSCYELTLNIDMPWRSLHQSLCSLTLWNLPKLVKLPKGMQYLTSLQSLTIIRCSALESLPEWMPNLTSLTRLDVESCSKGLVQRCQSPNGEDWPHIQHIPHLIVI